MTVRRWLRLTEAAYAVLRENKRGDLHWEVRNRVNGALELEVDSATYDQLIAKREEWNLATLSDVIIHAYKLGNGKADGALGSEAIE